MGSGAFVMCSIDTKKDRFDLLVFKSSGRDFRVKMLVISTAIDLKDSAECLDTMLKSKAADRF